MKSKMKQRSVRSRIEAVVMFLPIFEAIALDNFAQLLDSSDDTKDIPVMVHLEYHAAEPNVGIKLQFQCFSASISWISMTGDTTSPVISMLSAIEPSQLLRRFEGVTLRRSRNAGAPVRLPW